MISRCGIMREGNAEREKERCEMFVDRLRRKKRILNCKERKIE